MTRKILLLVLSIVALSCMTAKAKNQKQQHTKNPSPIQTNDSQSSEYHPFISEDKIWEDFHDMSVSFMGPDQSQLLRYKFDGTEEVDGTTYHVLKKIHTILWEWDYYEGDKILEDMDTDEKIALIREEEGKVWMYNPSDEPLVKYLGYENGSQPIDPVNEILLYDFNKKEGEELTAWSYWPEGNLGIQIGHNPNVNNDEIYEYFFSDFSVKEATVENGLVKIDSDWMYNEIMDQDMHFNYVESVGNVGMGCILGPLVIDLWRTGSYAHISYFNNLYDKEGKVLYAGENVQPPAHGGVAEIGAEAAARDMRMFDLMGREISNPLPGTVYIQNGRKLIAR